MSMFAVQPEVLRDTLVTVFGERVISVTVALGEVNVVVAAPDYLDVARQLRDAPPCGRPLKKPCLAIAAAGRHLPGYEPCAAGVLDQRVHPPPARRRPSGHPPGRVRGGGDPGRRGRDGHRAGRLHHPRLAAGRERPAVLPLRHVGDLPVRGRPAGRRHPVGTWAGVHRQPQEDGLPRRRRAPKARTSGRRASSPPSATWVCSLARSWQRCFSPSCS